jgi:ectoine hydroxylase-related dioxygenase (phytanoyl-CoA dioxygenase family)
MSTEITSKTEIVDAVRHDGYCVVPNVFSPQSCQQYCEVLDGIVNKRAARGEYFGSRATQVIYNYFVHDIRLCTLFAHPIMEEVLTELIDKDFVLISPSARNPRIRHDLPEGQRTSGEGWHVDSRVAVPATGELFRPSMAFYSVVALEPFREDNSATCYIPRSHLRYKKPPNRDAALDHKIWEANEGSVIFFDSALWHRAGVATEVSRWSIFNMYGPWFMKPYFRFAENLPRDQLQSLAPNLQRILHLMSVPPKDELTRTSTLTQTPVFD